MGVVYCPRCQAPADFTAGQAYCSRCGWNRHVAALQIRSLQRLLPVFLLLVVALGFLWVAGEDEWEPFLYVLAAGALLYLAGRRWLGRSLERLDRLVPMDPERWKSGAAPDPSVEEEERARALACVPRPRAVALTPSGRALLAAMVIAALVFEILLLGHLLPMLARSGWRIVLGAEGWFLMAASVFFPVWMLVVARGFARQRRLLRNGEAAIARVIRQWKVRGNSWISYEFSVGGATLHKDALDITHRLYEGMIVPIFYDAADLQRQVACCAARYHVVLPSSR